MRFSMAEKAGFGILVALWMVWGFDHLGDALVQAEVPEKQGFPIEVPEKETQVAAASEPADEPDTLALLASADVGAGEKVFKKCAGCHTVEQGGRNGIGPNLWGIMGAKKAAVDGYSYSSALSGLGGEWSFENMDKFLKKPKDYAPGTKMSFAGLKKASQRAAVIAYLNGQSGSPLPLP